MIPVDQTIFSTEEEPRIGNCFSATIASLLEIPLEKVPYFIGMGKDWFRPFCLFLDEYKMHFTGTYMFHTWPSGEERTWEHLLELSSGIDGYFICGGKSPRPFVTSGHSVIYKDGKLVHDPYPSRAGLLDLEDALMIERR